METEIQKKLEASLQILSTEMLALDEIRREVARNGKIGMTQWLQNVEKQESEVEEIWNELEDLEKSSNPSSWKMRYLLNRRVLKSIKAVKVLREGGNAVPEQVAKSLQKVVQDQLKEFSVDDLNIWTSDFSIKNKIGFGGYGDVYKGQFHNGKEVAVKVLAEKDVDGEVFMAEVRTMAGARHCNLIKLLGFCFDSDMKALVYEYMENGSLDKVLYDDYLSVKWSQLYHIAIETAKALAYLHDGTELRIVHHDIKAANVLLDKNLSPKLTDFGLAKLSNRDVSHVTLTRTRGTVGYMAPEMSMPFSPITEKCDVYSFGVMLFEILGKRNNTKGGKWFPRQVWDMFDEERLEEILIECKIAENDKENAIVLIIVALWCVQFTARVRPSMSNVVKMLEKEIPVTVPKNPFLPSLDPSTPSSQQAKFPNPRFGSLPEKRHEGTNEVLMHGQLFKSLPFESTLESKQIDVDENHQNLVSNRSNPDHNAWTKKDHHVTTFPIRLGSSVEPAQDVVNSESSPPVDESLCENIFQEKEDNSIQEEIASSFILTTPLESTPVTTDRSTQELQKSPKAASPSHESASSKETDSESMLSSLEEMCPPGGEDSLIMYTTRGGMQNVFEDCNYIRWVLQGYIVSERDLWKDPKYAYELKKVMGRTSTPVVFFKGRLLGGAKELRKMQEENTLCILLRDFRIYKVEEYESSRSPSTPLQKITPVSSERNNIHKEVDLGKNTLGMHESLKKVSVAKPKDSEEIDSESMLQSFPKICPPGGENALIMYTTQGGKRTLFEECNDVRSILRWCNVSERDIWMDERYKKELLEVLGEIRIPVVFLKGRLIGGAKELKKMQLEDTLRILLRDFSF